MGASVPAIAAGSPVFLCSGQGSQKPGMGADLMDVPEVAEVFSCASDVLGFDAKFEYEYPGWSYAEHSPVRDVFLESYRELFDTELRIESIHAGLECGLFAEALDGLDAIAVGPTLKDVHTPDESMELASSERFYTLLVDVLKRLAA